MTAAVFGLGEQVGGDVTRIGAVVGQHEQLAGAGEHVNADFAEEQAFGGGDVGVAGPEDFRDAPDRFRAERHGGDGLRAADLINLGRPGQPRGVEERRVDRRRAADDDLAAAGHFGERDGHDDRRDQRRGPTGHVDADAFDGIKFFADDAALGVAHLPAAPQRTTSEGGDVAVGQVQGALQFGRTATGPARAEVAEANPVELRGQLQ